MKDFAEKNSIVVVNDHKFVVGRKKLQKGGQKKIQKEVLSAPEDVFNPVKKDSFVIFVL